MTKIKITNENQEVLLETLSEFNQVCVLIKSVLIKQDSQLFLDSLSINIKTYLNTTFSISIKELAKHFTHKFEVTVFIQTMVKFGYLIKYHTAYKITAKYLDDTVVSTNNNTDKFSLNENLVFNETLGLDLIKYMLNSKNFQKSTFISIIALDKKSCNEALDYLIYQGYLTKTGTTYCITEKFKKKAERYQKILNDKDLFNDQDEDFE